MYNDITLLAKRQSHTLATILDIDSELPDELMHKKAFALYRRNLIFSAARSLEISYPALKVLIGSEALGYLAKTMLLKYSPSTGDWADWGHALADVVANSGLNNNYPWLASVAKLEWMIHQASRSPSHLIDIKTLELLNTTDLDRVSIRLNPTVFMMQSQYPIDSIWKQHNPQYKRQHSTEKFIQVDTKLNKPQYLLIFQKNQVATLTTISTTEYQWLQGIRRGVSVGQLLDQTPDFDFVSWLSIAIEMNLIEKLQEITPTY